MDDSNWVLKEVSLKQTLNKRYYLRKVAKERGWGEKMGGLRDGEGDIDYNQASAKEKQVDEHADSTLYMDLEGKENQEHERWAR